MSDETSKKVRCSFCSEELASVDLLEKHLEESHKEDVEANSKSFQKIFQGIIDEEKDKLADTVKDARKVGLYGSQIDPEEVKTWDWKRKAVEFVTAIIHNDYQKIQVLVEGTTTLGGFIVPEEWANQIVERRDEQAVMRKIATIVSVSKDTFHVPKEDTMPIAQWRAESAVKSTTTAQFAENVLTPYSLAAIVVVSEELFADAMVDVAAFLTERFARAFARAEDAAFFSGSGTAQPTGVDTYTLDVQIDAGGALSGDHVINLFHRLNPAYRTGAVWVGNSRTISAIRQLKDTSNQYLMGPLGTVLPGGPAIGLMGRPVFEQNDLASSELYFGDFKGYWIADRQEMSVELSREATVASRSMFERDEIALRAHSRVDGELVDTHSVVKITNTGVS